MNSSISIIETFLQTLRSGMGCTMVTVLETKGSTPRKPGAKMLIRGDGTFVGTVGGGKFESLVIDLAKEAIESGSLMVKTFPLHESDESSFGAICGGEITVVLEPYAMKQRLLISGAGHCGQALASLALDCGWPVVVFDDRKELFNAPFYQNRANSMSYVTELDALNTFELREDDCVVLVSRGHNEDRAALQSILTRTPTPRLAYLGMIGSLRKVTMVVKDMEEEGISTQALKSIYAPIGLDIGSESPTEIAVSIMAEILKVTRRATGEHMCIK